MVCLADDVMVEDEDRGRVDDTAEVRGATDARRGEDGFATKGIGWLQLSAPGQWTVRWILS